MDLSAFTVEMLQWALVAQQPHPALSKFPDFKGSLESIFCASLLYLIGSSTFQIQKLNLTAS